MTPTRPRLRLSTSATLTPQLAQLLPFPIAEPADLVIVDGTKPTATGVPAIAVGDPPPVPGLGVASRPEELTEVIAETWLRLHGLVDRESLALWLLATGARGAARVHSDGTVSIGIGEDGVARALDGLDDGHVRVIPTADGGRLVAVSAGSVGVVTAFPDGAGEARHQHSVLLARVLACRPRPAGHHDALLGTLDHDVRSPAFAARLALTVLRKTSEAPLEMTQRIEASIDEMLALVAAARSAADGEPPR